MIETKQRHPFGLAGRNPLGSVNLVKWCPFVNYRVVIPVLARHSASARRRENGNPGISIGHGFLLEFMLNTVKRRNYEKKDFINGLYIVKLSYFTVILAYHDKILEYLASVLAYHDKIR